MKAHGGSRYIYSSILSSTSVLDGGGWLRPRPCRYPLDRRAFGPQGRCGRVRKISPNLTPKLKISGTHFYSPIRFYGVNNSISVLDYLTIQKSVTKCQPTPRNFPEEQRTLPSHIFFFSSATAQRGPGPLHS